MGSNGSNGKKGRDWAEHMRRSADSDWRNLATSLPEAVKGKTTSDQNEAILQTAKAMRDARGLDDEIFFLIASSLIMIAEARMFDEGINPALDTLSAKIIKIAKEHGLAEDEHWPIGEGPEEYERLQTEYDRVSNEIVATTFDEYGESEIGNIYRYQRDQFDSQFEIGRMLVFEGEKDRD